MKSGQCVAWVKKRREDLNFSGYNANRRDDGAISKGFLVNYTPRVGSAFVVEGTSFNSKYGHTGIVEKVSSATYLMKDDGEEYIRYTLEISDYNSLENELPRDETKKEITVEINPNNGEFYWNGIRQTRDIGQPSLINFTHEKINDAPFLKIDETVDILYSNGFLKIQKTDGKKISVNAYREIFRNFALRTSVFAAINLKKLLSFYTQDLRRGIDPSAIEYYGNQLIKNPNALDQIVHEIKKSEEWQQKNALPSNKDFNQEQKSQIGELPQDDDNFPYLGFIAGKVLGESSLLTGNLYTGKEGGGDAPVGQRGKARLKSGVNTVYSDNVDPDIQIAITSPPNNPREPDVEGFIYTRWGSWDGAGKTIPGFANKDAERGFYVIGRSTAVDDVPKSGKATYDGEVKGIAFSGEDIGGTVELEANFDTRTFDGTLSLQRANGTPWVNLKTGAMTYRLDDGRDFEITFSNNGAGTVETPAGATIVGAGNNVRGSFFGKAGEEVAGDWAVYNVPDSVGGADGVFRAKKKD